MTELNSSLQLCLEGLNSGPKLPCYSSGRKTYLKASLRLFLPILQYINKALVILFKHNFNRLFVTVTHRLTILLHYTSRLVFQYAKYISLIRQSKKGENNGENPTYLLNEGYITIDCGT